MHSRSMLRLIAFVLLAAPCLHADALDDLARDFWAWRAQQQPVSFDDIPRLERPAGFLPDWSPEAISRYQRQLEEFETRWKRLNLQSEPVSRRVDYRLVGSALARVRWELEITRNWQRNPTFYLDQTIGAYFHLLLPLPPFDAARTRNIVATLASFSTTLGYARQNLSQPVAPFARLALDELKDANAHLLSSVQALKPFLNSAGSGGIDDAARAASTALDGYRDWLNQRLPSMASQSAVGRDSYLFFLKNVALLPYTPEQMLAAGRQDWARSVASQTYEEQRNLGRPPMPLFKDQAEQIAHEKSDELAVRRYLEAHDLLSVPAWMPHYTFAPLPAYLEPLSGIGEFDDFPGPSRIKENGIRYIGHPSPSLPYFALSTAKDPRGEIVHEGVPGHYFQLALGWSNPDPIRRRYYDSGANEGIGFYAEEMMLHAGLFDDRPRSREIIWNFMRLRALRVEVDVKLALNQFTIEQAAEYLKKTVPMDAETANAEASFFASTPGQAISYQIGKLQIYDFLANARRQKGDAFSMRAFHDFLWQNGNVPIALQQWEFLGLDDQVAAVDHLQ